MAKRGKEKKAAGTANTGGGKSPPYLLIACGLVALVGVLISQGVFTPTSNAPQENESAKKKLVRQSGGSRLSRKSAAEAAAKTEPVAVDSSDGGDADKDTVGSADDEDVVDGHSDVTGVMLDGGDTEWRKELAAYETGCEHRILAHLHLLRACADAAAMSRCRNLPL